jgi:hypothetical protein
MSRKLPPPFLAKFFEGVEDTSGEGQEWAAAKDLRPARLGLGADPNALKKQSDRTVTDRKLVRLFCVFFVVLI